MDSSSGKFAGRRLRFGAFEVDLDQRELRNRGIRVHLQRKPFQILELLLQRPGALVTRTELAQHLWPGLHVSFDPGLNTAINVLRQALGDSSAGCRFIETRPGLGYRFLASVEEIPAVNFGPAADSMAGSVIVSTTSARYKPGIEAYRDYQRGRYLQNKLTETDLGKSIAHFESAIAQDPGYALAYVGLAEAYSLFAFLGMLSSAGARSRAEEATMIALRIDDELAEAHASLGNLRKIFDWDYTAAEREYRRALQLSPGSVDARRAYAAFLSAMGRPAEAIKEIRQAQEADPFSLAVNAEAVRIQHLARNFEQCIDQAWQTLVLEPQFAPAQHLLGLAYEQVEMYEEAMTELQNAQTCSGEDPAVIAALGHAHARAGRPEQAGDMLSKLDGLSQRRYVSPYWRSIVYAGLGAKDLALGGLEKAFENRDVWLVWLNVEPRFDPLRTDPRFNRLLEAAGFKVEVAQSATRAAGA
ncbi:MAG: winged helix-turn-helix domain-containing protein [Acidobacteriaceae bacterium]|nr:winged helix-turn-helix domain-containing protein [Acidobacteriaceae bacterium]